MNGIQITNQVPGRPAMEALLSGADVRIDGERPWDIQVHDDRLYSRVLADHSLGLGEAYMDGWWDADALDQFFYRILREGLSLKQINRPALLFDSLKARWVNGQSKGKSKRVAECHYNLGNRFFERMLGPHMQYSCGYWKDAEDLTSAQEAKLDLVCRKLQLQPGDTVMEFGGGWGGFAKFAAERYGCQVTIYNISEAQVAFAREDCQGLPVEVLQEDYRNATGRFDKVVSIGMFEHVGALNYEVFFRLQRDCLKEDGLMLLHTIGRDETGLTGDPWFSRYIFPGGQLPSMCQITTAAEGHFTLEDFHNFGHDYDPTLMAWFRNFEHHWPEFREEHGENFHRMWEYYLLSCAGSFRARRIHLWQLVFSPRGVEGGYQPVR